MNVLKTNATPELVQLLETVMDEIWFCSPDMVPMDHYDLYCKYYTIRSRRESYGAMALWEMICKEGFTCTCSVVYGDNPKEYKIEYIK